MDVAQPELCTGPIAESYPPQCVGPVIGYWDWADHKGEYDQVGEVRCTFDDVRRPRSPSSP